MAKTKIIGEVSKVSPKTVSVLYAYKTRHPKYQKIVNRHRKYLAHDEEGIAKVGDKVEIEETTKISKQKNFKVNRVI